MINQGSSVVRVIQLGSSARHIAAHISEDVEIAIAESVMEEHATLLGDCRRSPNDVDDRDEFRVSPGQGING